MSTRQDGPKSPPITSRNDLVAYFEAGAKPPDRWRIGTEHEKFGFELGNSTLAQYDRIWDFSRGQGDKIQLGNLKSQLFDYLDDNNDGELSAPDVNVFDDGDGLELDFSGYFGKSIYLNVEHVSNLQLSDFIV